MTSSGTLPNTTTIFRHLSLLFCHLLPLFQRFYSTALFLTFSCFRNSFRPVSDISPVPEILPPCFQPFPVPDILTALLPTFFLFLQFIHIRDSTYVVFHIVYHPFRISYLSYWLAILSVSYSRIIPTFFISYLSYRLAILCI